MPGGIKLNLEIHKAQCDPTAEVYPLPAHCVLLVVHSVMLGRGGSNASVPGSEVKHCT
jgi:hypothetical protein